MLSRLRFVQGFISVEEIKKSITDKFGSSRVVFQTLESEQIRWLEVKSQICDIQVSRGGPAKAAKLLVSELGDVSVVVLGAYCQPPICEECQISLGFLQADACKDMVAVQIDYFLDQSTNPIRSSNSAVRKIINQRFLVFENSQLVCRNHCWLNDTEIIGIFQFFQTFFKQILGE
jgi:hypothetical protein